MRGNVCICDRLVVLAVLLAVCLLVPAQSYAASADKWQWEITPYYWRSDINGDASVSGVTLPVDVSFSDIEDKIDTGILLHVRAMRPSSKWGYLFDVMYLNMDGDHTFNDVRFSSDLKMTVLELGTTYSPSTPAEVQAAQASGSKKFWWAWLGGLRYFNQTIDLSTSTGESGSADQSWVEPMIGATGLIPLDRRLSVGIRGDIGGFSVGDSKFTWSALVDLRYHFSRNHTLNVGYKWLRFDTTDGGSGADITFNGPVFGVSSVF